MRPTKDGEIDRVAQAIATVAAAHHDELRALRAKGEAWAREPEFLWEALLRSYATLGRAAGSHGLFSSRALVTRLGFEALRKLPMDERRDIAEEVFREAGVRYPKRKAGWVGEAVEILDGRGGAAEASTALRQAKGAERKREKLRYPGIGPKYERNLMMDLYDPDFRDCIAVDARIRRFARELDMGLEDKLPALERFFLAVARRAGLDGWTVDRVLFWWSDEVRRGLGLPVAAKATRRVAAAELARLIVEALGSGDRDVVERVLAAHRGARIA